MLNKCQIIHFIMIGTRSLGQTTKLEGTVLARDYRHSATNCKFWQRVPQTTHRFNNLLEGLREHTDSCYIHGYGLLQEKIHIKISQGKMCAGWSPGKFLRWSLCCPLPWGQDVLLSWH